jgi:hypothetical protein
MPYLHVHFIVFVSFRVPHALVSHYFLVKCYAAVLCEINNNNNNNSVEVQIHTKCCTK